jgi:hypothetical protein
VTRRPLAALAAVAPLLVLPAATAGTGADVLAGTTCALVATAGQDRHDGHVTSGPWETGPGSTVIGFACSVQVGSDDPAAPDAARVEAAGNVLPPAPVSYLVGQVDEPVFVCTEVVVVTPPGMPHVERYDADPTRPGPQCRKAERHDDGVATLDVAPADPTTIWCVRVDDERLPYGYQEVCNPFATG